ncbi:MAG: undecaprenyl-phosphate glucose phosphotransferase [Bradyrhizobium sp.]|nr:undecaprenyl-phosphate glucose phosphotransferase [Bradyrhizobium sp.]
MSIGSDIRNEVRQIDHATSRNGLLLSPDLIPYILSTSDALVIMLSSVAGGLGYQLLFLDNPHINLLPSCAVGLLASFIHILRMSGTGYYDLPESAKPSVEMTEILVCWFTTGILLAFFAFLLKVGGSYSRGAFFAFYAVAPIGLLAVRKLTKIGLASAVDRGGIARRDAVMVGSRSELTSLQLHDRLALVGATDLTEFRLADESVSEGQADTDGAVFDMVDTFVRRHNCREVLLVLPWSDTGRIEDAREHLKNLPVSVRLLPDSHVRSLSNFVSSARQRVVAIEIQRAPLSAVERFVKRCMDVVVAAVTLALLLPVLTLTAIAIKLDSKGPVIFRQRRKGFNGKQFVMLKFRTMRVLEDGPVVVQASREDPRVTPIGRLLRAASIDELPQLINVLKGEMSLIGPRPHALAHDDYFERILGDYAFRHHVKPGMTGWAQCNGRRGATPRIEDIAERVKLDLWYVNNWSLWLDVQILIKTAFEVARKRNAY